jgi:hypothetical protein
MAGHLLSFGADSGVCTKDSRQVDACTEPRTHGLIRRRRAPLPPDLLNGFVNQPQNGWLWRAIFLAK